MITHLEVYGILTLNAIVGAFALLCIISFLVMVVAVILGAVRLSELRDHPRYVHNEGSPCQLAEKRLRVKRLVLRVYMVCLPIFILTLVAWTLIPTTKQAAVIYFLPKIANNRQIQKLPNNVAKALNVAAESYINQWSKK